MTKVIGSLKSKVMNSITAKFALAGGLLLFLIILVAATGYFSLSYVRKVDNQIYFSTTIQHLVLDMDRKLEEARRLHGGFFLHYQELGLNQAHEIYAQPSILRVAQVIKTGERLAGLIEQSPVNQRLKQKQMDLNLFFSSAKRFADTSIRSIELVTKRVRSGDGIEPRLDQALDSLYSEIRLFENLRRSFRDMKKYVLEYKLERRRFHMQSAFNMAAALEEEVALVPFLSAGDKKRIKDILVSIRAIEEELLAVDAEIKSIFNDFTLQDEAMETVSETLVALALEDVRHSRHKNDQAYATTLWIMLGITLLGVCLALLTALAISRGVTRKLVAMTKKAAELRMGNLDVAVPEDSTDEFGELARTFNVMTGRMKEFVYHLEDLVDRRTRELEETNQKLQQEIQERVHAEKDKEQLENQLRQAHKMEAIGTLAGGIAHDFNNVLAAILGYTEMAMDDIPSWNPARYALTEVLNASNRAKEMVRQILAFSRKSQHGKAPVRINDVLDEAMRLLRASIPTTIDIRVTIDDEAMIQADSTQIHQVIMNLCTNAAQAMDEKGGVLAVSLGKETLGEDELVCENDMVPGPYVVLTVADEGGGIDPEIIGRIFDPYFTTKEVGKGSGMGLSVALGIVKSHGGMIRAQSRKHRGTTFRVFLPVVEDAHLGEQAAPEAVKGGKEHILVVDDEPAMAEIHGKRLQALGYQVTTRTRSLEALEFFKTFKDDVALVLTDQTMPQMTGEQLSRELLKIRPDIPIIISTGFSSKIDEAKARGIGIKAFLMKPIDKPLLSKTVRGILDHTGDGDHTG